MKQRKNISKVILFAGLLMLNNAASGFYQCVPKKEWVKKVIKEEEDKNWEFVKEVYFQMIQYMSPQPKNISLEVGSVYKFIEPVSGKNYILSIPYECFEDETGELDCNRKQVVLIGSCLDNKQKYKLFDFSCKMYVDNNFITQTFHNNQGTITIKIYKKI